MTGPQSRSAAAISSIVIAGVTLGIAAWRLQFGVDVTDDAFYVALPVRLASGAQPFVDEWNLAQIAALFVTPFIKLYLLVCGIDGVVLFSRVLNLLVRALTAGAVFVGARRVISAPAALAASLITLVFVPINVANNSYNTIAIAGLTAGCFLSLGEPRKWQDVLSGVCHGIVAVSYPPFALVVLVFLMLRRRRVLYIAGAAIPVLIVLAVMVPAGFDAVERSLRYAAGSDARGMPLFESFRTAVISTIAASPRRWLVPIVVIALCVRRLRYVAVLVPLVAAMAPYARFTAPHGTITWIAILGAFALVPLFRDERAQQVFRLTIVPGAIAGLLAATFSSNGYLNFAVGGMVAAQGALVLLMLLLRRDSLAILTGALAAAVLLAQQFAPNAVYRDDDVPTLRHRMRSGAFAGLRTTDARAQLLASMQRDLAKYGDATVLFYYDFPAGYLLAPQMPPLTNSLWTMRRQPPVHFWPEVVVRMRKMRLSPTHAVNGDALPDTMRPMLGNRYRTDVLRENYEILVRQ